MNLVIKHVVLTSVVLVAGAVAAFAVFVWSGVYNVAADVAHTEPVHALLDTLRERSMATHTADVKVPDLSDPALALHGAGNYAAMRSNCHLAPGMGPTELSKGLYPAPPNLSNEAVEPEHAFWAIKHGIKASGMPAWGKRIDEPSMWNLTAFVRLLSATTSTSSG